MADNEQAVDISEIVYVLRQARDGWPDDRPAWTTDGFAAAAWHGFLTAQGEVELTGKGRDFLDKWGVAYPEYR